MSIPRNKKAYDALFGVDDNGIGIPDSKSIYSKYFVRALALGPNHALHPSNVMTRDELDKQQKNKSSGGDFTVPQITTYKRSLGVPDGFKQFITSRRLFVSQNSLPAPPDTSVENLAKIHEFLYWAAVSDNIDELAAAGIFGPAAAVSDDEEEEKAEPAPAPPAASPASFYPDLSASDPEPAPAAAAPASFSVEDGA